MIDPLLSERLRTCVIEGDGDRARALVGEALDDGVDPLALLDEGLTPALRTVGDCWERGEVYLPEMILSAEAVKTALAVLKPRLAARVGTGPGGAVCVLGTVRGDIHDIGKNIVGTLLEAFGFTVVDLGIDVPAERFVEAVGTSGARLVGLSALLTSTMPHMRTVIDALRDAGQRSGLRIAVGGAPITPAFATAIGADGTAEDGAAALRLFQALHASLPPAAAATTAREVDDAV
jgi:5-methyltetrahydrofolate--homocysteine methyltransferase